MLNVLALPWIIAPQALVVSCLLSTIRDTLGFSLIILYFAALTGVTK